ncbi:hypothetical protein GIB67_014222 [Kingdonia uniflora]|uniref:Uncharacterized protein n=1 Tax=Kingdonia uniflora TaxID=39325 RepID=A0A7J7M1V4_9MAGN|nr:hypothetical protein GIB67_014222 [Kingdonia uniflora]
MCDRYGSHVLRSLLCICKGLPLDSSEEHHVTKSFTVLAERFNIKAPQFDGSNPPQLQHDFPDLLKFLVTEMLKYVKQDIVSVLFDQYSSLVLQTCLKLLAGEDQELMHIIYILLGFHDENNEEGNFLETIPVQDILSSLEDNAFSHLMEVILQVAPETLYDKILTKVFKNSLFKIASHHCGSFVVQALVSSVRCQGQMDLIWEELGGKFKELLEVGRSGVIASILVATQRLQTHGHKCCQVLAAAVCSTSDIPICIIPRLLFLDNYLWCEDKLNWKWAAGDKMHVLGCLMLQTVFKYPSECFQSYITSITSVEDDHVLQITKDARGGRVIEAFLSSDVSAKHKRKLIVKLKGHFGELSMLPSGSFTVEKCFTASNAVLKETIVSELLDIRSELSKTRQGPHLLRKLDVDGYAARPDQWRSRQASKKKIYKDFCAAFGSRKTTTSSSTTRKFVGELSSHSSQPKSVKEMRDEIGKYLMPSSLGTNFPGIEHSMAKLGFSGFKHRREGVVEESNNKKFKHSMCNDATLKRRSDEDEIGKPSRKKHKM